jgi:hypothetical protein
MEDLNSIHWHNCILVSSIEVTANDLLALNVQYPENVQDGIYSDKAIMFNGFYALEIHEQPVQGSPTIDSASVLSTQNGYTTVRIETSAGYRLITAEGVSLGPAIEHI